MTAPQFHLALSGRLGIRLETERPHAFTELSATISLALLETWLAGSLK